MSITVNLYTFAKKVNSTGRPSSSPVAVDCVLKDACSIIYPVIGLDRGITWNPAAYNYAYISAFNRYYYVNDWSFAEGLWWASLGVDALASWRSEIMGSTEYVLRASETYDDRIIDDMFPAKTTFYGPYYGNWGNSSTQTTNTPWSNSLSGGFYVVGIVNKDASSIGAVSYYAFNPSQFEVFKGILLGNTSWTGILVTNPDIGENLFKALFNPFQYITSIYWFPFSFPTGWGTQISILDIGWWELSGVYCTRITTFRYPITGELTLNEHPQAGTRGKFLNSAPYSEYRVNFPPFGQFELEASKIGALDFTNGLLTLSCNIEIDFITGSARLIIFYYTASREVQLVRISTQLAIPIQLAQIYSENTKEGTINKIEKGLLAGAKELIFGTSDGGVLNSGILNALSVGDVYFSQIGSNGSLAQFADSCFATSIHHEMTQDALNDKGRPLCQSVLLSTLSPGYVITAGSHVAIAGTETEISAVNAALDGGVFLE